MSAGVADLIRRIAATACLMSAAIITVAGCSDGQPSKPAPASRSAADFNNTDTDFVLAAGQSLGNTLTAAQLAQSTSSNPDVRAFARDLTAAKGAQIDRVASWLRDWGERGAKFGHDAAAAETVEPRNGLSQETMTRLTMLTGPRFDRLFLAAIAVHLDTASKLWEAEASKGINPDAIRLAKQLKTEETEYARRARSLLDN
ncbi:MAG: DUF305 domain-containing protein [Nocardioidaceae bacterium]